MRKTHKDRVNLIDRLERKYARKLQLKGQGRRQAIKNRLRAMRGRHEAARGVYSESVDGMLTYKASVRT